MNEKAGLPTGSPLRPHHTPAQYPNARLTDADILEAIEGAYEAAIWYADLGVVDFSLFASLPLAIRELWARRDAA